VVDTRASLLCWIFDVSCGIAHGIKCSEGSEGEVWFPYSKVSQFRLISCPCAILDALDLVDLAALVRPPDFLPSVVDLLPLREIKDLSCASTRLREACLPTLFRRVEFEFSETGIGELRGILKSDVRCHVVSFTYAVPDLFIPGKSPLRHLSLC
jgi:hypothetical protein